MSSIDNVVARELVDKNGSPLYIYDRIWLEKRAQELMEACRKSGVLARYAIKANPYIEIIKLFEDAGLHFDASSDFEAKQLIEDGINPDKISLSSQQPPSDVEAMLNSGVHFVATSLHQLVLVQQSGWQGNVAVRINPGVGAGHSKRTTTGGVSASFGIWHEYIPEILAWQNVSGCNVNRVHIHIGAGVDPGVWRTVIQESLTKVERLSSVEILDIGGGYKVARMDGEKETDLREVVNVFIDELDAFYQKTGRKLKLEMEPGTWLVANCGVLLTTVVDIVDTGSDGYKFIKLDTGMNDILRPGLYGAQHPITVLNDSTETEEYVVVGHNCESGDILTPAPGEPEELAPRKLAKASIGDLVTIGGTGAYCASMRAHGYNSFPSAKEVMI